MNLSGPQGGGIMSMLTEVVKNLLIINVLVYLAVNVVELGASYVPREFFGLVDFLGLHYFDSDKFRPFQLVTNMFVHANTGHLFFNMLGLFFLGPMMEQKLGPKKFLNFFFISGFGAVILGLVVKAVRVYMATGSIIADPVVVKTSQSLIAIYNGPTVGASGALYGIFVGFALFFPNLKMFIIPIPFPVKAKYLVMFMLFADLFLGVAQYNWDNTARFAHLGGALFGFLMIWYWNKTNQL